MRKNILSLLVLTIILASTACTPQTAPTVVPTVPPAAAATTQSPVPTAALTSAPAAAPVTLTVLAAASLTESFTEIGKLFETAHPNVTVNFSFAGSQSLSKQLDEGAPADVFASASKTYMEAEYKSGRVDQATAKTFARNRLVVITPKENPGGLKDLKDLSKSGIKLVLADKSVPVGQYALTFLDNASKDATYGAAFKDAVLKNVVSYEQDVKSVLTKVELGEADAGIVYTTDAASDKEGKTQQIAIPDALNVIASYPIAPIKDSAHATLAQAFVDMVLSPEGQAVLAKSGFIAPPAASHLLPGALAANRGSRNPISWGY